MACPHPNNFGCPELRRLGYAAPAAAVLSPQDRWPEPPLTTPRTADADINYLRRGGLGGGGVAGRRRSRLRDLQEHHGVEHAGGVGGAKRLLPKVRTLAGALPFSGREGMRGRERAGEHDGDDGERPGHGVHRRSYTLQTQSLTPSCPSTVISVAVRRATSFSWPAVWENTSV